MRHRTAIPSALALSLVCLAGVLQAQNSGAIPVFDAARDRQGTTERLDRASSARAGVPSLYAGEDEDVGPQSLLLTHPRRVKWEGSADCQYFYTGNTFLQESQANNRPVPTGLLVNSAQSAVRVAFKPVLGGIPALGAGYRHQWFLYGLEERVSTLNAFDFNAGTAFVEGHLAWRDTWDLELGFDYARLLNSTTLAEFYKDFAPHLALTRTFPVSEMAAWMASVEARYRWSDTDPRLNQPDRSINDRFEQTVTLGYSRVCLDRLVLQPYWRLQFSQFTRTSRNDLLSSAGLSATWFFHQNLAIRFFGSYDAKDSDDPSIPDYRKVDAGGGIHLSLRF